jgi:hypothetical protein
VNDQECSIPSVDSLRLPVQELGQLERLVEELTKAWNHRWKTLAMG